MEQFERSKRIAAEIIPKFANSLKTDRAPAVAISVLRSYGKLLRESITIFNGNMQLFNEVFNGVIDVMGAKVACQPSRLQFVRQHCTDCSGQQCVPGTWQINQTIRILRLFQQHFADSVREIGERDEDVQIGEID